MDEEQKKILDSILDDFNAIGAKAMMELSNGSGQFTITKGAWTVSLDVEGYVNQVNESRKRTEVMSGIISNAAKKWHEKLKGKEQNNELERNQGEDIH